MEKPNWLEDVIFSPVIKLPKNYYIHDFSLGPDPMPDGYQYGIGRYNEDRQGLYNTPLFTKDNRTIHLGIDIGAPAGEIVFSFFEGQIIGLADHQQAGDYGPTLIVEHHIKGQTFYALYGHLSRASLEQKFEGQKVNKGEAIGSVGNTEENGGWFPHLHFQLALEKPSNANMPGVASPGEREAAVKQYPDPRWVLGPLYI